MKNALTEQRSAEKSDSIVISADLVEQKILSIRGHKVMLDIDLAKLYGVSTKRLNEQVKRNITRFPGDFMFSLNNAEKSKVVAICDHLSKLRFSHQLPRAFTEQGIAMLSSVLNSERAVMVNIAIMRAFVRIRQLISLNKDLVQKLAALEHKIGHHDQDINELFAIVGRILRYEEQPKKKYGFETGVG